MSRWLKRLVLALALIAVALITYCLIVRESGVLTRALW